VLANPFARFAKEADSRQSDAGLVDLDL